MYEELLGFIKSVKNPYLNRCSPCTLWKMRRLPKPSSSTLRLRPCTTALWRAFGAHLKRHQALRLLRLLLSQLTRDLLITAAIFHDIGKIKELSTFPENDYTDAGQLLGHIMIGAEMVGITIRSIKGLSAGAGHRAQALHSGPSRGAGVRLAQKAGPSWKPLALNFADKHGRQDGDHD